MMKLLFVCLGNICRSPSAEAVMTAVIQERDLSDAVECDSAGTIGYHTGNSADSRMMSHAEKRGYHLTSRSRKFDASTDFDRFDMIIAMDDSNYRDLTVEARFDADKCKISKMTDYCRLFEHTEVPDPYYGGEAGFELVLDLLEDACCGLLDRIADESL